MDLNQYCVIMAGGIGSRFWPVSRKELPKQFLDFFGTGKTLLQQTFERFAQIVPVENIIISTNLAYSGIVKAQLPQIAAEQILHEPAYRGTAPSMAFAAYHIRNLNPQANIVMAPSDQLILNEAQFKQDIQEALVYVGKNNHLVTIGIKPSRPETRYGYIQTGEESDGNFHKIKTFTEKPELDFARLFMESGEFFWNTGLFIWNVNTIISTMRQMLPDMACKLDALFDEEPDRDKRRAQLYECYESFPSISVDYAVIEKAENMYMQIGTFGWTDIGRWQDYYEESLKDDAGNVVRSKQCELYNCKNNIIVVPDDRVAVIQDLDGYLVSAMDGVLVICKKDEDDDFKKFRTNVMMKYGDKYM